MKAMEYVMVKNNAPESRVLNQILYFRYEAVNSKNKIEFFSNYF